MVGDMFVGRALVWTTAAGLAMAAAPGSEAAAQAVIGGEWRDDVARFTQRVVDAGLTPGAGVAVTVGDRVAWEEGFGSADLDSGRAVEEHTAFYIASSTKSLTATAALLTAHRGELDLDAPMTRYLPDASLPEGVAADAITVRDLVGLTHGLSGNGPIVFRTAYTGEFSRPELLELLRYHSPTGQHGRFNYDNLGFNLLGLVLAAVHDEPWKDVVHRMVLAPLGMAGTTAYRSRLDPSGVAAPHAFRPGGFEAVALAKYDANLHAAGGHFATAGDLGRYLAAHLSGGRVAGEALLPPGPIAAAHRQHATQDRDFGPYHRHGWAFGWDIGTYEGDTIYHRFGGFPGYRSHMSFMPEHDIGVVVLVNGEGPASPAADLIATYAYERLLGRPGIEERFDARLEELGGQAAAGRRQIEAHLADRAGRLAPLPHPLADYAGVYHSPVLGTMDWRVVAGGLELRMGVVQTRAEVFDAAANQLRVEVAGGGDVVQFTFSEDGGPARSVILYGIPLRRVEGGG